MVSLLEENVSPGIVNVGKNIHGHDVLEAEKPPEQTMWDRMVEGFDQKINDIFFGLGDRMESVAKAPLTWLGMRDAPAVDMSPLADNANAGNVTPPTAGDADANVSVNANASSNVIELPSSAMKVVMATYNDRAMTFDYAAADRSILGTGAQHGISFTRAPVEQVAATV
jgi:hypothetical protein